MRTEKPSETLMHKLSQSATNAYISRIKLLTILLPYEEATTIALKNTAENIYEESKQQQKQKGTSVIFNNELIPL